MRRRTLAMRSAVAALAAVVLVASASIGQEAPAERTLYERLGGLDGVATLVDQLVDGMAGDETLQANPYIHEAMTRVGRAGLKYRLTTMLCARTGGPQTFAGRSMRDAHAHLRITGREWLAFSRLLTAAMDGVAIAESERAAIRAIVDPTANDIVVAGELDGQTFAGERGGSDGSAGTPDKLAFTDGRLTSTLDATRGVQPGIYSASVTDRTTAFEAELAGRDGVRIAWQGKVEGGAVQATVVTAKPGGTSHTSWFRGRLSPQP